MSDDSSSSPLDSTYGEPECSVMPSAPAVPPAAATASRSVVHCHALGPIALQGVVGPESLRWITSKVSAAAGAADTKASAAVRAGRRRRICTTSTLTALSLTRQLPPAPA